MSTPKFFTPNNHLDDNGIALAAEALMLDRSEALPQDIALHLESCDRCSQMVLDTADITAMSPIVKPQHHPFFDARPVIHRFPQFWYSVAALFLLTVSGGGTFYLFTHRPMPQAPAVSELPAGIPDASHQLAEGPSPAEVPSTPDRFTPSPNLDDLISSEFRSTTLEIIAPKNGERVSPPITFLWKEQTGTLKLKILTNKEVTILTAIVHKGRYTTAKRFEPGLYYWKLESDDELAAIGTFTIR